MYNSQTVCRQLWINNKSYWKYSEYFECASSEVILCCHSCSFSKTWERTQRTVLLHLLQSPRCLTWANWDLGTQRSKRKESSCFISSQIRVVVVLPWALPLRSGCVGILRNNRPRLFASFSNQLQLNAKTSTVSVYLSNIHPPNKPVRCCYPYFT